MSVFFLTGIVFYFNLFFDLVMDKSEEDWDSTGSVLTDEDLTFKANPGMVRPGNNIAEH